MAHIRTISKTGRFQARYRDPSGRERARNFEHRIDAERFCAAIEVDKSRGTWVDPQRGRIPFGPWAMRWLESRTDLKPKTMAGYESLLRVHILPHFGERRLKEISGIEIREWMANLKASGLSAARVRSAFMVLRSALQAAVDDAYLLRNPAEGVKPPRRTHREMLFIDAEEVGRLAEAAGPWDTLIYLLAYTGIRWGEAAALRRRSGRSGSVPDRDRRVDLRGGWGGPCHGDEDVPAPHAGAPQVPGRASPCPHGHRDRSVARVAGVHVAGGRAAAQHAVPAEGLDARPEASRTPRGPAYP